MSIKCDVVQGCGHECKVKDLPSHMAKEHLHAKQQLNQLRGISTYGSPGESKTLISCPYCLHTWLAGSWKKADAHVCQDDAAVDNDTSAGGFKRARSRGARSRDSKKPRRGSSSTAKLADSDTSDSESDSEDSVDAIRASSTGADNRKATRPRAAVTTAGVKEPGRGSVPASATVKGTEVTTKSRAPVESEADDFTQPLLQSCFYVAMQLRQALAPIPPVGIGYTATAMTACAGAGERAATAETAVSNVTVDSDKRKRELLSLLLERRPMGAEVVTGPDDVTSAGPLAFVVACARAAGVKATAGDIENFYMTTVERVIVALQVHDVSDLAGSIHPFLIQDLGQGCELRRGGADAPLNASDLLAMHLIGWCPLWAVLDENGSSSPRFHPAKHCSWCWAEQTLRPDAGVVVSQGWTPQWGAQVVAFRPHGEGGTILPRTLPLTSTAAKASWELQTRLFTVVASVKEVADKRATFKPNDLAVATAAKLVPLPGAHIAGAGGVEGTASASQAAVADNSLEESNTQPTDSGSGVK